MKTILATLFFLGLTTLGFSQTKTAAGSAFISSQGDDYISINCEGEASICYTITPYAGDGGYVRFTVPALEIDIVAPESSITVNGQSFDELPPNLPGNTDYFIQFQMVED
ncbi:hypothetical protein SAMN02927937_00737 [Paenimyroides aquimaris]|uniref:Uncharacterized protein n=1 Tax=Paenimyroides marinum TaxID=1159016 RepID=A0A1H6K2H9_9FLAO|nr:hypothetical protein [Paenimyroides aquimaris]SEH65947.1 hypothetical protein SAMN02927937_00737 [Paenimyroides aquimaris]